MCSHAHLCPKGIQGLVVVQSLSHVGLFVTHGLQHARLPCPSLSPRVCANSWPLNWWCHSTISSSVSPFSSHPQSRSFPVSQLFTSGGQSVGTSALALVLPRISIILKVSEVKSLSRVWLSAAPWTAAYQAPPSVGFSRREYWSGVPLPSPYCFLALSFFFFLSGFYVFLKIKRWL